MEPVTNIQRYGLFEVDGRPKGYWSTDIYPPQESGDRNIVIPKDAVDLTEEQYLQLINDHTARFVDGEVVTTVKHEPIGTSTYSWGPTLGDIIGSY